VEDEVKSLPEYFAQISFLLTICKLNRLIGLIVFTNYTCPLSFETLLLSITYILLLSFPLHVGYCELGIEKFQAKIGKNNLASLNLFSNKLQFCEVNIFYKASM